MTDYDHPPEEAPEPEDPGHDPFMDEEIHRRAEQAKFDATPPRLGVCPIHGARDITAYPSDWAVTCGVTLQDGTPCHQRLMPPEDD